MIIDAFGKKCPMPLMLAKKGIDEGAKELEVRVDNETAVENVSRLGRRSSFLVETQDIEGGFAVFLKEDKKAQQAGAAGQAQASESSEAASRATANVAEALISEAGTHDKGLAVFVGSNSLGSGSEELGKNLLRMAFFTLAEQESCPDYVLFMNGGVSLVAGDDDNLADEQIVESLEKLQEKGCEVLVCGTCLDYFGVKSNLATGTVSNMYDILSSMQEVAKVIYL